MAQPNGLPSDVKSYDTVTTHDWAHTSEWSAVNNSVWELVPSAGEAIKITGVLIKISEDMIIHSGGSHIIEGVIADWVASPYKLTEYPNLRTFLGRADDWNKLDYAGPAGGDVNKPIISLKYDFSRPVVVWSSGGMSGGNPKVDLLGNPRWQKMRCRIADNVPYKDNAGNPAQIVCSRYFVERYVDPFYTP